MESNMHSVSFLHKVIYQIVAIITALLLAFYPMPVALAQEVTETPEEPVVEQTTVEEPSETPTEEPAAQEGGGTDGLDGGDAGDGTDGQAAGDGGVNTNEPQDGGDGGDTGDGAEGGAGEGTPDTGGIEESNTGNEETTIGTGDATATGDISNNIDLTVLNALAEAAGIEVPLVLHYVYYDTTDGKYKTSDPSKQAELDAALADGILDPQEYLQVVTPEDDVIASTTNDVEVFNEADIEAETGQNTANNNEDVTIQTGDAKAIANVLNVVNTNIFDSEGLFLFLDNLGANGHLGDLDFRDFDIFKPNAVSEESNTRLGADNPITAICPTCGGIGDLTVNTAQNAEITNDVVVRSGTGANLGLGNSGDVSIETGDAYAAANTINVANTNIVDSNYLLLTFNNFGDFNNDIVFPAASEFLEMFGTGGQTTPAQVNANNTNTTDVGNNTDVNGNSGDNVAHENFDGGSIETGDASASSNTLNQINSNLFGGASFSILLKVHGDWNGAVYGVPDDMYWRETPEGIELIYDSEGGTCTGGGCNGYDAINVNNNNATAINNNVSVTALTGENRIEGGTDATIKTGDAYAAANTINVANTNVIGKNWLMAVVNIFGDFNGNITFGQPNLWVGAKANVPANAGPGTTVTYEYTVMNTGDAPATNVCLTNRYDYRLLNFNVYNPLTDREVSRGEMEYCIGTVEPGDVIEFTRNARIGDRLNYGSTFIENDIEVNGGGDDPYPEDNNEQVTFEVWKQPEVQPTNTGGKKIQYKPSPNLSITKVNASPFWVRASSTVDYRVIIKNTGAGSAYNAVLVDTLYNEDGEKEYTEYWNLGEIFPGEEIEVMYSTFFNDSTEPGVYRNEAHVEALGGYHTFLYGHDASTEVASSDIKIVPALIKTKNEPVVEVIEDSKEVKETLPEVEEDQSEGVDEEVSEVTEADAELPVIVALIEEPDFEPVLGPFHGPFYYEREPVNQYLAFAYGPLNDHPLFTQHPVEPTRTLFGLVDHPVFTSHPVFIQHSYFNVLSEANVEENIAFAGLLKFLKLPEFNIFGLGGEEEEEEDQVLALLALSMFVLRSPRAGRKNTHTLS
jgi:hypothetical protein